MRSPTARASRRGSIDTKMTPMIDVIFQLQIFFLCTAGFAIPESILPTELPNTGAAKSAVVAEPMDLEIIRVALRQTGDAVTIKLNDRSLSTLGDLKTQLLNLGSISTTLPVVLDIGPEVHLGTVVTTYDSCLSAGFRKISFAAAKVQSAVQVP